MSIRQHLANNIKNIIGWKTNRKIIVFSVDDYGNVRLFSKKAREKLDRAGLKIYTRFDVYDTLETRRDLEMLYDTLLTVKDRNGRHPVFTVFALPCNINFEQMAIDNYKNYIYETLPTTYEKLSALQPKPYNGAWNLWKQGIKEGLLVPQFHGREHFNLNIFNKKLEKRDFEVLTSLKNRSYTSISNSGYHNISVNAAFGFWDFYENKSFDLIIKDGIDRFFEVFGQKPSHFNPSGSSEHSFIHQFLKNYGIKYIDSPFIKKEHQGRGEYKYKIYYTGKKNIFSQIFQVRNVVFEPTYDNSNHVQKAIMQIKAAFKWNRPAIISSHRVNYCGLIDEHNIRKGLDELKFLLKKIVDKWPNVEFISSNELGDFMLDTMKYDVME